MYYCNGCAHYQFLQEGADGKLCPHSGRHYEGHRQACEPPAFEIYRSNRDQLRQIRQLLKKDCSDCKCGGACQEE